MFTKTELPELLADNRLWFGKDGLSKPSKKLFLSEVKQGVTPTTWWSHEDAGHNDEAKKELKALLSEGLPFETPKPTRLVKRTLQLATSTDQKDIVLDFFAGSGTTAQAVGQLNEEDGGNRQFILVQLPEPTNRTDYPTIAEITKERTRRALKDLKTKSDHQLPFGSSKAADLGFRVFKLSESNMMIWNADVPHRNASTISHQLDLHIHHLREERTSEDILYEILLKSGFRLTTPVESLTLSSRTVYSVASGAMFICLDKDLTHELIKSMADLKPQRVVCLDEGFAGNDQLKTNAVQTMKAKGVMSFRTI